MLNSFLDPLRARYPLQAGACGWVFFVLVVVVGCFSVCLVLSLSVSCFYMWDLSERVCMFMSIHKDHIYPHPGMKRKGLHSWRWRTLEKTGGPSPGLQGPRSIPRHSMYSRKLTWKWMAPAVWFVDFMVFRTRGHSPRNQFQGMHAIAYIDPPKPPQLMLRPPFGANSFQPHDWRDVQAPSASC